MNKFFKKFNAFLLRDLNIAMTYKFNLLINILFIFFILGLLYGISLNNQEFSYFARENYFGELLVGLALVDYMIVCLTIFAREVRQAQTLGTFEALLITKTSIITIILSSYALSLVRSTARLLIYISISIIFFDLNINLSRFPLFLGVIIYSSIPFIALGLISAAIVIMFKIGDVINFLISIFSIFLSGIFFPKDLFPVFLQKLSEFLPLTNSVELSKAILFNNSSSNSYLEYFVSLTIMIGILLPAGIFLIYHAIRFSKSNGGLSNY